MINWATASLDPFPHFLIERDWTRHWSWMIMGGILTGLSWRRWWEKTSFDWGAHRPRRTYGCSVPLQLRCGGFELQIGPFYLQLYVHREFEVKR